MIRWTIIKNRLKSTFMTLDESLNRIVGHLDLDYFFAQVEEVENPSLKNLPVVVCVYSGRTQDSGVVSTANYVARGYGVKSAIPIVLAKKKLEGTPAAFIPLNHEKYELVSERVMEILRSHVDVEEKTGIDEAHFDITRGSQSDYRKASNLGSEIKRDILTAEKLTCSIGLGQNKVIAKIASDFRKPDGLTTIRPDETISFLAPLSVEKLPGVGSKTTKRLGELGVTTIGELSRLELVALEESFGHKFGIYLYNASRGVDEEPVVERAESLQISRIITLKANSSNSNEIFSQLLPAVEDASKRMLEKKVSYRTLSVIGIYTDLSIKTKSKTIELPANDSVTLKRNVRELLEELVGSSKMEMRRAGVRLAELSSNAEQRSLSDYAGDQLGDADG